MLFYNFYAERALELCRSEVVGAFFATAEIALIADTAAAAGSRFVSHEIAKVQGELIIVVVPSEVLAANTPTVTANLVDTIRRTINR